MTATRFMILCSQNLPTNLYKAYRPAAGATVEWRENTVRARRIPRFIFAHRIVGSRKKAGSTHDSSPSLVVQCAVTKDTKISITRRVDSFSL